MNINNMTQNLFIMDHNQDISSSEVKARGDQLEQVLKVVHPKRIGKQVPTEYKKDVADAYKAIRKRLQFMKHNSIFLNIEGNQKGLAELASKFNKIKTQDGKTAILPIGLMALSQVKIKKPHDALKNVKKHVVEQTFNQLHTEYLKHKLKAAEEKQSKTNTVFDEEGETAKTEEKEETKSSKRQDVSQENAAIVKGSDTSDEAEQVAEKGEPKADSVKTETPVTGASTDGASKVAETKEEKDVEEVKAAEEKKIEEQAKVKKPKNKKPRKSKKKLGFWGSIANFFKNMFLAIFRFFSGKKKNAVQK